MTMLTKEEFVRTHPDVRVGMTAYTTDGEKLGVIERIDEDNLLIERGWFFHKDFIISYDDIEDVRENQVIVRQRREDLEEQRRGEAWETAESDLTSRSGEMGERAGRDVEQAGQRFGERAEETGKRLGEHVKEAGEYVGERAKEARTETQPVSGEVRKEEVKVSPAKPSDKQKK
jgi:hypothetical protein